MRIGIAEVAALERGVSLLGSGGGGYSVAAATLLRNRLTPDHDVTVSTIGDLSPGALVVPVGVVGAAAVFTEKLPSGNEFTAAVSAIEHWTGQTADAMMSIEVGGINGMLPLVAAIQAQLPYLDADLSGRGVPRLDQLSVAATGRGLAPLALAEPSGQVLVVADGAPVDVERSARAFLSGAGGWAVLALAPIPAGELSACAVPGTAVTALTLGRAALSAAGSGAAALAKATGGRLLGSGRVTEVARWPGAGAHGRAGFGRGSVTLEDHATQALLRLEMENEYLLALLDGEPVASTPDVLAVIDRRSGTPISCDLIKDGIEVAVLQLPAERFWTDPRRLPVLSPRAFGIDCDPILLGDGDDRQRT